MNGKKRKSSEEITSYYQKQNVAESYDTRRFKGEGGLFITKYEMLPILELLASINNKDMTVLELGAGRGRLTKYLYRLNNNLFCLERSEAMISFLSKILPTKQVLHQSVFDSIRNNQKFGVVTSLRFFDHFNIAGQHTIFKNLSNNISSESYFIYAGLNYFSLENLLSKFFPYGRYNYYYPESELIKLFKLHNFEVIEKKSQFFLPRGAFLYAQRGVLLWLFKLIDSIGLKLFPGLGSYQVYLLKSQ